VARGIRIGLPREWGFYAEGVVVEGGCSVWCCYSRWGASAVEAL